jgi:hypothetical protein
LAATPADRRIHLDPIHIGHDRGLKLGQAAIDRQDGDFGWGHMKLL